MNEAEQLGRELDTTMNGDPWYGTAVSRILDGTDAKRAARHPIEHGHSIWELVLHMTSWVNEVTRRLDGGTHGEPLEGDWPAVRATTAEAWKEAVSILRTAHADLSRTLAAHQADLGRQVAGGQVDAAGQPVNLYQTVVGILQHDAYHAGQIALLKKLNP